MLYSCILLDLAQRDGITRWYIYVLSSHYADDVNLFLNSSILNKLHL